MNNRFVNVYLFGLIVLALLFSSACSLGNTETVSRPSDKPANVQDETGPKTNSNEKPGATGALAVAGTYKYNTVKNDEGYDNSLEIEDKGNGKLHVSLSGSYLYKIEGTPSMHDAGGDGDGELRGNKATIKMTDEVDKPCLVAITFTENQAAVKIPENCHFNVVLEGVYKKSGKNSGPNSSKESASNAPKLREVSFNKLADFVNDTAHHKVGESYVITDVPTNRLEKQTRADENGNRSYKGLYYLESNDGGGDVATGLLTSETIVKGINTKIHIKTASLRVTAVLAESNGQFDVYRLSFVTRIEGLEPDGTVIWTLDGGKPAKIKFEH